MCAHCRAAVAREHAFAKLWRPVRQSRAAALGPSQPCGYTHDFLRCSPAFNTQLSMTAPKPSPPYNLCQGMTQYRWREPGTLTLWRTRSSLGDSSLVGSSMGSAAAAAEFSAAAGADSTAAACTWNTLRPANCCARPLPEDRCLRPSAACRGDDDAAPAQLLALAGDCRGSAWKGAPIGRTALSRRISPAGALLEDMRLAGARWQALRMLTSAQRHF